LTFIFLFSTLDSSGLATFSITTLTPGTHSVFASYNGDLTFNPSNSTTSAVQVVSVDDSIFTNVTGNPNPSLFGSTVTLSATVGAKAPGGGTPSGFVTFYDGPISTANSIGAGILSGGVATFSTASLSVIASPHTINVQYSGDTNFNPTTGSMVQTISVNTNTVLHSSGPAGLGQTVTFTATVTTNPTGTGAGTPIGTVTFYDGDPTSGGQSLGTGTLNGSGVATFTDAALAAGAHTIFASYAGTPSFRASTGSIGQTIDSAASITVSSSFSTPSTYGQTVIFTATVTASPGTPTGTVTFYDGDTLTGISLGTAVLNGSTAIFGTNALHVSGSPHTITAQYEGDAFFAPVSNTTTQSVSKVSTGTTVTSSGASGLGQTVTFKATVVSATVTPTGTVTFYNGDPSSSGVSLGTGIINTSGVAIFHYSGLPLGSYTIFASYAGTTDFGSSSDSLVQDVSNAVDLTATISPQNTSVFGQTVSFTATVQAVITAVGTPTGSVTFYDGDVLPGNSIGVGNLTSISAGLTTTSFSISTLSASNIPHTINVFYSGDSTFATFTLNPPFTLVVNNASTEIKNAVSSTPNPSLVGTDVTFKATVDVLAPGSGKPTGSVTFYDGGVGTGTSLGTATLDSSGVATFHYSGLSAGTHGITAQYGGDSSFDSSSTSTSLNQVVNPISFSTKVTPSGSSTYGDLVTFQATVSPSVATSMVPTGTVVFHDGSLTGAVLGSGTLNGSGVATFSTNSLVPGTHSIFAQYAGDANFHGNTGNTPAVQVVGKAVPKVLVQLSSLGSPVPSSSLTTNAGDQVTMTATITTGLGNPTGTVTFYRQTPAGKLVALKSIKLTTLAGGIVTFNTNRLPPGTYAITAVYKPDTASTGKFKPSTPASTTTAIQTVIDVATALKVVVAPVQPGVGATFSIKISAIDFFGIQVGSYGAPNTATVTFGSYVDPLGVSSGGAINGVSTSGGVVGSVEFVNGQAVLGNLSADKVGTYSLLITTSTGLKYSLTLVIGATSGRQH
jgi:hypothetical protein